MSKKTMKFLPAAWAFFAFLGTAPLSADQTVSGDVSGTWYSGETITVVGDIRVPSGLSLVIEPGVNVLFTGRFKFTVNGLLDAVGTPGDWITLTRAYPTHQSKWRGFRFDGADDLSLLDYCHVEHAYGDGAYPDVRGGAVWVSDCSPTFRRCLFNDNYSHNSNYNGTGGAISLDSNSSSLIEHNRISLNEADSGGGICVGAGCDATIRFNVIDGNEAFNGGGGIYVSANARSTIHGNVIRNNTSGGWGGGGINLWSATWLYGTYSHVHNNLIIDNSATSSGAAKGGGGIYSRYDTSRICNNTLSGNHAYAGGGIYVLTFYDLPPLVTNCIVRDNTASASGAEIYPDPTTGSTVIVTYSNVKGGWPGTGNIDADPLFVEPGDYHLTYSSPCKDAGDNTAPGIPTEDFEGDPRIADGIADMGIDEFHLHLYQTGTVTPGGTIKVKVAGAPGTSPVTLVLGSGIQDPPQTTQYGDLYLVPPYQRFGLGAIPASGVLSVSGTVPGSWLPGEQYPFQALAGPAGNPASELTNLTVMDVE